MTGYILIGALYLDSFYIEKNISVLLSSSIM